MSISAKQVAEHTTREKGVWVIIHNKVYDVTEWLDEHPGGSKILLKYAGKDATEEFEPIHPEGTLEDNLPSEKCLGELEAEGEGEVERPKDQKEDVKAEASKPSSSGETTRQDPSHAPPSTIPPQSASQPVQKPLPPSLPPLDQILSLHDFESLARLHMKEKAWAYYSSGADDEITMRENHKAFHRIWFRPRVLRDVRVVDYSCKMLGFNSSMPVYITATALGKLGHPDGELNLTRAAGKHNVIQMIPTLASCSLDEMLSARLPDQTQFLQLYVNADRERTKKIIRKAEAGGVKALFVTVDAPQLGRREKDMRMKFEDVGSEVQNSGQDNVNKDEGAARAISSFIDPSLSWSDLAWFKSVTKLPILLKGVQCYEDVILAIEAGMQGVVLSNHGGRQLEFARSGIEVLVEVTTELRKRKMWPRPGFEIFVDGGVRRASDVLKAIALGATAVGIGRPMLYAMSTYGQDGVERALQILKDEFEMNLRLIGAPKLSDVTSDMIDARGISNHVSMPGESLFSQNYETLVGAAPAARL